MNISFLFETKTFFFFAMLCLKEVNMVYLWTLDCESYLSNLADEKHLPPFGSFETEKNLHFISIYKNLSSQAEQLIQSASSGNFLYEIHKLIDIDMRLYYLLLLMIYNDGLRTEEEMLRELERNYKLEYLSDSEHFYPFSDYRLIVEHI